MGSPRQRAARGGMFYVTAALAVCRSIPHSSTYLAGLICAPATEAVSIGQSPSYSQRFHDTIGIGIQRSAKKYANLAKQGPARARQIR